MTVIVTGAAGFIGSHLARSLENKKKVIYCDVKEGNFISPYHCVNILKTSTEDIECVYHLGAISSTTETNLSYLTENNIQISSKLMDICIQKRVPFVYASSASVYGLGSEGFSEDAPLSPLNYYAISKAAVDMYALQKIQDNPGAKIYGLRYFNVYGNGEDHKGNMASPVHKFLKQARSSGNIKIFEGSDNFRRDFVHVQDVVSATINISSAAPAGIYNVGAGVSRTFQEVAEIIAKLTGASIEEIAFPNHLKGKYQSFTESNNLKINATNHSTHRLSLEQGIVEVFNGS